MAIIVVPEPERTVRVVDQTLLSIAAIVTLGVACCVLADFYNNVSFGLGISLGAGAVFAAASCFVGGLPMMLTVRRWGWVQRAGIGAALVVSVLVTVYAAMLAYGARQSANINAAVSTTEKYEDSRRIIETARAEMKRAQADAGGVEEVMRSADLEKMAESEDAAARIEEKDRRGCGDRCLAHERNAVDFRARAARARAKEAALARVAAAEQRISAAQTAAPTSRQEDLHVELLAKSYGMDKITVAQIEALGTNWILIIMTITGSLCSGPTLSLWRLAVRWEPVVKPVPVAVEPRADAAQQVPAVAAMAAHAAPVGLERAEIDVTPDGAPGVTVVKVEPDQVIEAFFKRCVRPASERYTAKDVRAHFAAWWRTHGLSSDAAILRHHQTLAREMRRRGYRSRRDGNRYVYDNLELLDFSAPLQMAA